MSKAFKIIAEQYDCPVSYRMCLTIKTLFQNISITLLQISLSRTSRRLLEEKAPVNDCERTVPSTKK